MDPFRLMLSALAVLVATAGVATAVWLGADSPRSAPPSPIVLVPASTTPDEAPETPLPAPSPSGDDDDEDGQRASEVDAPAVPAGTPSSTRSPSPTRSPEDRRSPDDDETEDEPDDDESEDEPDDEESEDDD